MKLFVLIGQRKCRYESEYAPEALAVMDQFGMDDNPDYMDIEYKKYQKSDEFSELAVIPIKIPWDDVNAILFANRKVIKGKVLNENS